MGLQPAYKTSKHGAMFVVTGQCVSVGNGVRPKSHFDRIDVGSMAESPMALIRRSRSAAANKLGRLP